MTKRALFQMSEVQSKAPISAAPKCGACGLYKKCKSPKMGYSGKGRRKILIIVDAPTNDDDQRGRYLTGTTGKRVQEALTKCGIDMLRDCWVTGALICHPGGVLKDAADMIDYCQPNLRNLIEELQPEIIIPLGMTAIKSLISMVWKDHDIGGMTRWHGWRIPCQKINAWICPTFHPTYLFFTKNPVPGMMFDNHIKAAATLDGSPWPDGFPDYEADIEVVMDVKRASRIIDKMIAKGGDVAFDFENNCLKPEPDHADIVCCSVCWEGKKTIAFPWHGEVVDAMRRLIRSDLGKIASNMKHEERWCKKVFGVGVRNWVWCTMTAAHWLDNRKGITGLKFQSFVELGLEEYNSSIEPFLKADHSNAVNRIKEVELTRLLKYCGKDSLLEYLIAYHQGYKKGWMQDVGA
jgi:uracil-DNA glycosylase family 4